MSDVGYCTLEDVREALQETESSFGNAELSEEFVKSAIRGQSEWLQETTNRHWYDPQETDSLLPTEPLEHAHDEQDIPSSPHASHTQAFQRQPARHPVRFAGPYTRVTLTRRDVTDVTELLVRQQNGSVEDWTERYEEGRGEQYYLQSADHSGHTYLYLHTGTLPRLSDYGAAVVATYEYGIEGITSTVRRAVAFKAGAELLRDDESAIGIPDSGQLVNVDTKADKMEQKAHELLEIHL